MKRWLATEWHKCVAVLALMIAAGSVVPAHRFGAGLPQTSWGYDPINGSDNAICTTSQPCRHISEIAARLKPTRTAARIQYPAATTITVTALTDQPDCIDPASQLWDADFQAGSQLVMQCAPKPAIYTGTIASVTAFTRTSAGGQIAITDAGVANYGVYFQSLFHDKTNGAVGELYGPQPAAGASATGFITPARTPSAIPFAGATALVTVHVGDQYELLPLTKKCNGNGSPRFVGGTINAATVITDYRCENIDLSSSVNLGTVVFDAVESIYDGALASVGGASIVLWNSLVKSTLNAQSGTILMEAGAALGARIQAANNGSLLLTNDVVVAPSGSSLTYTVQSVNTSLVTIGVMGFYPVFETDPFLVNRLSKMEMLEGTDSDAVQSIVYGTTLGSGQLFLTLEDSYFTYNGVANGGVNPAQNSFAMDNQNFNMGGVGPTGADSAFGWNRSTGAYVGPTSCTLPNLDAALGAGVGFGGPGGVALSPGFMNRVGPHY